MKTSLAVQCIVLLACLAFCSSLVIPKCRCLTKKQSKWVDVTRIASVQDLGLRPYCNKREVIVTLKDGNERCLDPEAKFTIALLKIINNMKIGQKMTVSAKTTTAASTTSNSS